LACTSEATVQKEGGRRFVIHSGGIEPSKSTNTTLANWLAHQRQQYKKKVAEKKLDDIDMQQIKLMDSIGIRIWCRKQRIQMNAETDWYSWEIHLQQIERTEDDTYEITKLQQYLSLFQNSPVSRDRKEYNSLARYVVAALQVGDIKPWECTRDAPVYDIRYVLSYICNRFVPSHEALKPTFLPSGVAIGGISPYFHIEDYGTPEIRLLFQNLIRTLPSWMEQLWKKEIKLDGDQIVKHICADQGKWFDPYMVSYNGTDPKGGGEIITESKKGAPRRQHLSVQIHGLKWSPLHNRCFEEGYGYGNSTTAKPWLGFRCLRDYPFVMDLEVAIWKRLHHHFDGPSKQCPPTSCNDSCIWASLVGTSIHTKTTHLGQP
jgi:hypothetical protein